MTSSQSIYCYPFHLLPLSQWSCKQKCHGDNKHCHFCSNVALGSTSSASAKQAPNRQKGKNKKMLWNGDFSIRSLCVCNFDYLHIAMIQKTTIRNTFSSLISWPTIFHQAARGARSALKVIHTKLSAAGTALKLTGQIKGIVYIIFISVTYESFKLLFSGCCCFFLGFFFVLRRPSQYIPALYAHIMNSAPAFFFYDWIFIFALVVGLRIRSRRCRVYSLQALYMKVKKMGGENKKQR